MREYSLAFVRVKHSAFRMEINDDVMSYKVYKQVTDENEHYSMDNYRK